MTVVTGSGVSAYNVLVRGWQVTVISRDRRWPMASSAPAGTAAPGSIPRLRTPPPSIRAPPPAQLPDRAAAPATSPDPDDPRPGWAPATPAEQTTHFRPKRSATRQ